MKESGENMWLKNLPAHTPPGDMWEKIEARMDNDSANEAFRAQLAGLPEHEPPFGLWARIEQGLVHRKTVRLAMITSGIAATLLIAFLLKGLLLTGPMNTQPVRSTTKVAMENRSPEINPGSANRKGSFAEAQQEGPKTDSSKSYKREKFASVVLASQRPALAGEIQEEGPVINETAQAAAAIIYNEPSVQTSFSEAHSGVQQRSVAMLSFKVTTALSGSTPPASLLPSPVTASAVKNISKNDTLLAWLLARTEKTKYPPPPSAGITAQPKGVSIGFNYLPEPVTRSDNGASAYQTFALMAKYQLLSIDLQAGLGISYQSAPLEYRTDYASFSAAYGNGRDSFINNGDTLTAALLKAGSVDISGKERSSFLYYTVGAGKRIYSKKRISTTLRVGAGFSLLLTNQDKLRGPVFDALNSQSNTFFGNTKSNIPDINRTHFDLVTGLDFNYSLHKRWSLSIEPTLKYYFNPVYNGNNARSFSTGLLTGIQFKL